MQEVQYNSLGLKWPLQVPSTLAECVTAAGSEDAVVSTFNDKVVYHSVLTGVREDFVEALIAQTGIARKTKVTGKAKDGTTDIVVPAESEQEYVERVCAQLNVEVSSFSSLQAAVLEKNPYDAKPRERKAPTPKTPTKGDYAQSDAAIAAGKADDVATMLSTLTNTTVASDRDSLAKGIMAYRQAEEKKAKDAIGATLGIPAPVAATPAPADTAATS